jgi:hypothetical protein
MSRAAFFLKKARIPACFPYAKDFFIEYLSPDSYWLKSQEELSIRFKDYFAQDLNSQVLHKMARLWQVEFEKLNGIEPFSWKKIIYKMPLVDCIFVCGEVDFSSPQILELILSDSLIIFHEPFPFLVHEDLSWKGECYDEIAPKILLYQTQKKYVEEMSHGMTSVAYHIRRGDYDTWDSGKYYYSDEVWLKKIDQALLKNNRVWIFSNDLSEEFQDKLILRGCLISGGSATEDFVRLMCMQFIYGPPSTYTHMATSIANQVFGASNTLQYMEPVLV